MESPLNPEEKFGLVPLAALALIFVIAAPVFWQEVELRPSTVASAPENEYLRKYYAPVYEQAYEALRGGRIPLWDATRFCGTSTVSDPRIGLFQPLNLVFLLAPFPEAFAAHAFTCLAVAGIVFVLLARSMGVGFTAALFGGLCFTFSGAAAGAMSRPPLASALVWIPIVLWSVREHSGQPRAASVVFMGLALAGLLLTGALAVFTVMVCLCAVYMIVAAFARGRKRGGSWVGALGGFFAAIGLSACVSAVQLLPTVQAALQMDDPGMIVRTVLPAGTLPGGLRETAAQTVAPEPASLPSLIYLGIVGMVFLPAALIQRRRLFDAWFYLLTAIGLTVVAVLYGAAFPPPLPAYALVYPAMGCAAASCALGLDRIMRKRSGPGREWYWLAIGLVLCACVGVFVVGSTLTRGYVTATAAIVIVLLIARGDVVRVVVGLVLCGLAWTNLVTSSRNVFGHPFGGIGSNQVVGDRGNGLDVEGGRLVVAGEVRRGFAGFDDPTWRADGLGGLFSRDEAAWWRALSGTTPPTGALDRLPDLRLLNAMSVSTIVAAQGLDVRAAKLSWTTSGAGFRHAKNDAAVPRAHWVSRVVPVDGIDDAITSILDTEDGVAHVAFVDSRYPSLAGIDDLVDAATASNATTSIEDLSPEHIVVTLRTPSRGVLVLADSYSPDWRATLDGKPATVLRVNGFLRGLVIPEGEHVAEFHYRPMAFYVGGVVSLATLVLLALWGIVRLFR